MGKIRMILYRISKMLPYHARKPVIAVSMTLGSYIFFKMMLNLTHSAYLMTVNNYGKLLMTSILQLQQGAILIAVLVVCLGYFAFRRWQDFKAILILIDMITLVLAALPYLGL